MHFSRLRLVLMLSLSCALSRCLAASARPFTAAAAAGPRIARPAFAPHGRLLSSAVAGEDARRIALNEVPRISFDGTTAGAASYEGDALVIPVYQLGERPLWTDDLKELDQQTRGAITEHAQRHEFKAGAGSKLEVALPTGSGVRHVCLVGLGKPPSERKGFRFDVADDDAQQIGAATTAFATSKRLQKVGVVLPPGQTETNVEDVVQTALLNTYVDNRFRTGPRVTPPTRLNHVSFLNAGSTVLTNLEGIVGRSYSMARGNFVARDIVGAPSNVKHPVAVAELASELASKWGLELNVLTEDACRQLGMGAYLGVAQGSRYPPQFMHLTYRPASSRAAKKIVLIGKTMTFDSGGYNLKVGDSMIEKMKMDVGGGAAVLGAAKILSELQPQVEVHFILPACENMISDRSYRPGDIITASNGRTIEVDNTDAEGRLTLADALVYGEKLKPDAMVTVATLTGAIIVALGDNVAGFFTGHPDLKHKLEQAAQTTKEPVWHMPMVARCKETLKSSIADMVNSGKTRAAGSITAAQFLQDFVESTPYAHVDIAGTAMDMKAGVATGYGARLLAQLVLTFDGKK